MCIRDSRQPRFSGVSSRARVHHRRGRAWACARGRARHRRHLHRALSEGVSGMLYVCATPIGNLGDVTPRVLDTLRAVELVAAEDTRHTRKLLSHFDIHVPLTSLFQHNEAQKTEGVLRLLRDGKDVALVTDAGLPSVQDPGMRLVVRAVAEGLELTVLPGPSAVLTALVAAGYDGDGFRFVGYLPRRARELETMLQGWRRCGGLVVAFETGQRRRAGRVAARSPRRRVPRAHQDARSPRASW